MMDDLDELRTVLAMRADLAPNPDDLIPATRKLARRRQVRRRGMLLGGVVVLTTLALVGAGQFGNLLPHNRSATQPGPPLAPPTLPFTVGDVPNGYWLNTWYASDGLNNVQFFSGQSRQVMDFQSTDYDPSLNTHHPTSVTVNSHPAVLGIMSDNVFQQVSWQATPGMWMAVSAPMDTIAQSQLLVSAESVSLTPTTEAAALHIASLPDRLTVNDWFGAFQPTTADVTVTLCPPGVPGAGASSQCVDVHMGTGAKPRIDYLGPLPNSIDSTPVVLTPTNIAPVITMDGHVVTRQVDSTHWVAVMSTSASPALLLRLATAATVS